MTTTHDLTAIGVCLLVVRDGVVHGAGCYSVDLLPLAVLSEDEKERAIRRLLAVSKIPD